MRVISVFCALLVHSVAFAKSPLWYGLSPSVSLSNDASVNAEPDNFNDVVSTGVGLNFAVGKLIWPKTYVEPLSAAVDFTVSGEVVGNSSAFRNPNFDQSARPSFEAIPQSCYASIQAGQPVGNECFARQVDDGAQKRLNYSDLKLTLSHGRLAQIPYVGVNVTGRASLSAPTSLQSRNEGLYTALGAGLGLARAVLGDKLSLSYGLSMSKPFRSSDTFIIQDSTDAAPEINGTKAQVYSPDNGKSRFTTFSITNSFTAAYTLPFNLGASVSYSLTDGWKASLDDCTVALEGSSVDQANVCENRFGDIDDGKTLAASQLFVASLSWDARSWLSLGVSLTTATPLRKPNSASFYQPFIHTDRNGFSSIGLSASVTLDQLYAAALQ